MSELTRRRELLDWLASETERLMTNTAHVAGIDHEETIGTFCAWHITLRDGSRAVVQLMVMAPADERWRDGGDE